MGNDAYLPLSRAFEAGITPLPAAEKKNRSGAEN